MTEAREQPYTIDHFVEDVERIMGSGEERGGVIAKVTPLLKCLMDDDRLLRDEYRVDLEEGRFRYEFFRSEDESLTITAPAFLPGRPTPVHDHLTWGVIGVYSGQQLTTRYRRRDDGSRPGRADLEVAESGVLTRGATYPLLPPDDIHRIEALGAEPGISIHVLGSDLRRQKRHIFHPESGTVEDWDGGTMMR